MLATLRSKTGGIIAKAFIGLLALSFAVWGINDIFTGYRTEEVTFSDTGDAYVTSRTGTTTTHVTVIDPTDPTNRPGSSLVVWRRPR